MRVSVVIPTRNRAASVSRLMENLNRQTQKPDEVILVDSSDNKDYRIELIRTFTDLPLVWVDAPPAVCIQRNVGVKASTSEWIFLCDDDIELPENYIERLTRYLKDNPTCKIVAGKLLQYEASQWVDQYPPKSFGDLLWRFVFQLPIWGTIDHIKSPALMKGVLRKIKVWYQRKGNTETLAGWPLITDWEKEVIHTKFYSLGANILRRDLLLISPYDEVLDPSGIGDNYGVIKGLQGELVHVLSNVPAYHHRASENRLKTYQSYFRRILALHYFNKRYSPSRKKSIWLMWSLLGRLLPFVMKGNWIMAKASWRAISLILKGNNPYWIGYRHDQKTISPVC